MAVNQTYSVPFRRKREGRTNYRKRLKLLDSGRPRLVVRKSLRQITCQLIRYAPRGDEVLAHATSLELKKMGWELGTVNISAAYLTGLLLGRRAAEKRFMEAVLDIGKNVSVKGGRFYSALKGAIDAGISIPCSEVAFPKEERINGSHIAKYAALLKSESEEHYKKRFSGVLKRGGVPADISKQFTKVKDNIMKGAKK